MTVLVRSRSPFNAPGTPILVVTLRRRECDWCGHAARITVFSPSTARMCEWRGKGEGQCCIRCTRELRS
ncbi:MAG TPA: hypothetical protein VK586_24085 [Streptosporangiaceae bacterium]|nr:hypothetical protein [Streptosporangiaceae bacterium]